MWNIKHDTLRDVIENIPFRAKQWVANWWWPFK
jgi:hypothetical protein